MTTRLTATGTGTIKRWTEFATWPDVRPGETFEMKDDRQAANLIEAGLAVLAAPDAPITARTPAKMARGLPGFSTGVSNA